MYDAIRAFICFLDLGSLRGIGMSEQGGQMDCGMPRSRGQ
jgi:hypothetical protein